MTLLTVVQSAPDAALDVFAPRFTAAGLDVRVVAAFAGEAVPAPDEVGDGLVVLGGPFSVRDDAAAPWLAEVRALLAEVTVPTLGICLGAQLLAVARGGRVQVDAPPGLEGGVVDVRWRPEVAEDPVLGPVAALADARHATPSLTLHRDAVVDLPAKAVWLGSSQTYPYQAFRVGAAWGVQFHPESSVESVARWAADDVDASPDDVRAAYAARAEQIDAVGATLADAFAARVQAVAQERVAV
ncbi:type 1 glutamine amidotransferase [Cellulomonas alba]|uniref:Type 1 glutamine amidotransferase n=1 Tax=Cellulomonas alba TaxID=3053467 RepID=A0ABT7SGZ3_9CELL|nr:type 1 glutamine amidotransferase [Cellulomonas alba]MDM7855441.1 type 1 glutamine amidotransferase [Cellulomonas alba]